MEHETNRRIGGEGVTVDYKCAECGGRTILCTGVCHSVIPDAEPYEAGKIEETEFPDGIDAEIYLSCRYCPECESVWNVEAGR
jgi:hypothetical protein